MGADEIENGGSGEWDFADREAIEQAVSEDGVVTLAWGGDGDAEVILEQSGEATFGTVLERYRGSDPGSVITGLEQGTHYFRIRSADSTQVSEPLAVKVQYVSRRKLSLLLGLGGAVVVATIATILAGHFSTREDFPTNEEGGAPS